MGGFYAKLFRKKECRILIHGLDAAGKTTLLYRLKLGEVVTTIPTIGFNVETLDYKNVKITAWDIGGRDKIRPLWRHYYANTEALVLVVDSGDPERLEQARDELHRTLGESELRDTLRALVVLANKQDLPGAMSAEVMTEKLELYKIRDLSWNIFQTVATSGEGVYEAFDWLSNQLAQRSVVDPTNTLDKPQTEEDEHSAAQQKSISTTDSKILMSWGKLVQSIKSLLLS